MQEYETADTSSDINELIDKATGGDGNTFGRLYDMNIDRVYRHIYYRVSNSTRELSAPLPQLMAMSSLLRPRALVKWKLSLPKTRFIWCLVKRKP